MSYHPDACVCGHVAGDHLSGGTSFPHPVQRGACMVSKCDCATFVALDPEPDPAPVEDVDEAAHEYVEDLVPIGAARTWDLCAEMSPEFVAPWADCDGSTRARFLTAFTAMAEATR